MITATIYEIASNTQAHALKKFRELPENARRKLAYDYFMHDAEAVNKALEAAAAEHKPKGIGD